MQSRPVIHFDPALFRRAPESDTSQRVSEPVTQPSVYAIVPLVAGLVTALLMLVARLYAA